MVYIQDEEMRLNEKGRSFKKNHALGIEFDRYILEHPEVLEQIPEDAEIIFST